MFGTPKILKNNEIVLRQARKVVGPKAPGAHRAHCPRPLGPIGPIRSHAVAWVRDRPRPGPSNCMAAYGPYGPQGPWTMGPMGPRGLGPIFFLTYICLIHLFVYFVYLFNICLIVLPIELPIELPLNCLLDRLEVLTPLSQHFPFLFEIILDRSRMHRGGRWSS